jgi:hypothetical protein
MPVYQTEEYELIVDLTDFVEDEKLLDQIEEFLDKNSMEYEIHEGELYVQLGSDKRFGLELETEIDEMLNYSIRNNK